MTRRQPHAHRAGRVREAAEIVAFFVTLFAIVAALSAVEPIPDPYAPAVSATQQTNTD